jgi:hypothetical protein
LASVVVAVTVCTDVPSLPTAPLLTVNVDVPFVPTLSWPAPNTAVAGEPARSSGLFTDACTANEPVVVEVTSTLHEPVGSVVQLVADSAAGKGTLKVTV